MKKMRIRTPYGEEYFVDLETGHINQSKGWKFVGFCPVNAVPRVSISLKDIQADPGVLERIEWTYKNGNPRYTVRDLDYGTTRAWGNTRVHGVKCACMEKE